MLYKKGVWGEIRDIKNESKGMLEELKARNGFSTTNAFGNQGNGW